MENCESLLRIPKVKVTERGKTAVFNNPDLVEISVVRFDGCVVDNLLGADFIVRIKESIDVIVELKGKDVSHAVDQIAATIAYLKINRLSSPVLGALVVCSKFPKASYSVQKKIELLRKAGAKPKVVCTRWEGLITEFV